MECNSWKSRFWNIINQIFYYLLGASVLGYVLYVIINGHYMDMVTFTYLIVCGILGCCGFCFAAIRTCIIIPPKVSPRRQREEKFLNKTGYTREWKGPIRKPNDERL